MSIRSKRLAKYLEQILGWEVYNRTRVCPRCNKSSYEINDKYCRSCGKKMEIMEPKSICHDELEEAIKYALGEGG